MAFIIVVFLFPAIPHPTGTNMNYTVLVFGSRCVPSMSSELMLSFAGGTLLLSVLYFYFPVYGGVHWFNGPVSTIKDGAGGQNTPFNGFKGENNSEKATIES